MEKRRSTVLGALALRWVRSQDSSVCAGNAYTSTLCVLEHKLLSLLPVSDPSSDPQSVGKWVSNLLTVLRYKSKNVDQYLANMSDAYKGKMKVSFFFFPLSSMTLEPKNVCSEKMKKGLEALIPKAATAVPAFSYTLQ